MLDLPTLVYHNMVCGSNTDQRDHFPMIHPDVSLCSGIHQISIPTFPLIHPHKVIHDQLVVVLSLYNYDAGIIMGI